MGKTRRKYKTDEICLSPAYNYMYCPTAYKLKQGNFSCILNYLHHNFMKNMYHLLEFHFYHCNTWFKWISEIFTVVHQSVPMFVLGVCI